MSEERFSLGEFEEIVLYAVLRLRENAYGVTIRQLIETETKRTTSIGAVYTTLERLERKGYISSRQGESTPERGGRAKRYFKVESQGILALNEKWQARSRMMDGLDWRPAGI